MNYKIFISAYLILGSIVLLAFTSKFQHSPWEVPAKYVNLENPYKADSESLKLGKQVYTKHCKSCHGNEGLGDGTKAAQLDTPCGDFTLEAFKAQTDGSIFYKTKFGRDDMPTFEKKIPYDEDIWHVVNYIRTFK